MPSPIYEEEDNSLSLCVDYRPLNAVTLKQPESFPRIDTQFDQLAGTRVFFEIYLRSGSRQTTIQLRDVPKIVLSTR